uniref:Uncharacterized protein n=1 Tax=Arundo donax TaxID=35708 RepID=A0A0A9AWG4_ARUDO
MKSVALVYFEFATCMLNEASMICLALGNFLLPKCGPWSGTAF